MQPQAVEILGRILSGGREAINQHGYHGAGIDEIVRAARVSRATFYMYFDGKSDLLRALVIESMEALNDIGAFPTIRPGAPGARDVKRWLTSIAALESEYGGVWEAWRQEFGNDVVLHLLMQARLHQSSIRYADAVRSVPSGSRHRPEVAALMIGALQRNLFSYLPPTSAAARNRELDTVAALIVQAVTGRRVRPRPTV